MIPLPPLWAEIVTARSTGLDPVEVQRVSGHRIEDRLLAEIFHLRDGPSGKGKMHRLISYPRFGAEYGTVGFQQQAIQWEVSNELLLLAGSDNGRRH